MRCLLLAIIFCAMFSANAVAGVRVATSLWVLGHFVEVVGGERVEVVQVIPPGAEPHEYEPSPKDIVSVLRSDLFIFQDEVMEPWAGRIRGDAVKEGVSVIEISAELDPYLKGGSQGMKFAHSKLIKKNGAGSDPHVWLDPRNASIETEIVRDALISLDPDGSAYYKANADEFIRLLGVLDKEFRNGLSGCMIREIVVSHDAYSYLARRYDFKVHAVAGLSPQGEPSPGRVALLAGMMQERGIRYVFTEPLANQRIVQTLASEAGAEVLQLSPLGSFKKEYMKRGPTYMAEMRENLKALRLAMRCK